MPYVLWFERIKSDMLSLVGGKALHLGEMVTMRMPVPPGFAVTTEAFEKFLDETGIRPEIKNLLEEADIEDTKQLIETSDRIKELITSQEVPLPIKNAILEAYNSLSFS